VTFVGKHGALSRLAADRRLEREPDPAVECFFADPSTANATRIGRFTLVGGPRGGRQGCAESNGPSPAHG
jgi:hypothetical protein